MGHRFAKLSELATLIGASFVGEDVEIDGLGFCNRPTGYHSLLSYLGAEKYMECAIENKHIAGLVVSSEIWGKVHIQGSQFSYIIADYPEDAFYQLHMILAKQTDFYERNNGDPVIGKRTVIHSTAVIDSGVVIGDDVQIGPYSVVNNGCRIGNGVHIGSHCVISGAGFQILRNHLGVPYNVPHVGGVEIGREVWIGDAVTICNSIFEGAVVIGAHTQIDSHCHVGHNCSIGSNSVLAAGVILFGSAEVEDNCWLAPGSMVMNRTTVMNGGIVGANSFVNTDVTPGSTVIGTPAELLNDFVKNRYYINKLWRK